ncbi:MAG: putative dsRNA-binding protein, partial [Acidobacteria bacterium]|nr:putative dsRNA-binding protein [Acidobacteriota bacterium]
VYFDGGIKKAEAVISRIFKTRIKKHGREVTLLDFKTRLQEIYQEEYKDKPVYITKFDSDKFFSKAVFDGKVIGKGEGLSKKDAEQEAARAALEKLEKRKRGS